MVEMVKSIGKIVDVGTYLMGCQFLSRRSDHGIELRQLHGKLFFGSITGLL